MKTMKNKKATSKLKIDKRFVASSGIEIYNGVELIVKGLLEVEGGSHLWTGYPGSPVATFFDIIGKLSPLLKEKGIRGAQANNEALGAAMLNGSQMLGLRGVACMKSVGLHVASDAIALGNMVGAHHEGGALVLIGDDPWNESTQVPADSRFLCRHLHMPVIEPSTPQELKDWVSHAFHLSRESGFYMGYIITTYQADGAGTVDVHPNQYPKINMNEQAIITTADIDTKGKIGLPPYTNTMEQDFPRRRELLWKTVRHIKLNTILYKRKAPIGFITSGYTYTYLEQAFSQLGLSEAYPILKLGITYPLDPESIVKFASTVDTLVVVEEKEASSKINYSL